MIYLITRGNYADYEVSSILEGPPGTPIDDLWKWFEAELNRHVPKLPPDYHMALDWEESITKYIQEKNQYLSNVAGEKMDDVVDCFIATLVRDHGMKRVEYLESNIDL